MANNGWDLVYGKWKSANPTAKKVTRVRLVRGCIRKMAHPDFLSAMIHAESLANKDNGRISIYACPLCGQNHVGRYHGSKRKYEIGERVEEK